MASTPGAQVTKLVIGIASVAAVAGLSGKLASLNAPLAGPQAAGINGESEVFRQQRLWEEREHHDDDDDDDDEEEHEDHGYLFPVTRWGDNAPAGRTRSGHS